MRSVMCTLCTADGCMLFMGSFYPQTFFLKVVEHALKRSLHQQQYVRKLGELLSYIVQRVSELMIRK